MLRNCFQALTGLVAGVAAVALLAVPDADAQRPSLARLQAQINQINAQLEQGLFEELRVLNQIGFGKGSECRLFVDPDLPGLNESDPTGFRLLGRNNEGCRLIFGPTLDCTIEVNPQGPPGLLLYDPNCIRICVPPFLPAPRRPTLYWGPTNECSIGLDPEFPGLVERDPVGFRLLGRDEQGCRLIFGPTLDCTVEVDPLGPEGLLLYDPRCIRICTRDDAFDPTLYWGPTNECSIGIDRDFPGLVERDPVGFRLLGRNNEGCRLLFGPTDLCTIEVNPPNSGLARGLLLYDPFGIRICVPPNIPTEVGPTVFWGDDNECSIGIVPGLPGLAERDPRGFRLLGRDNQGCRLLFGPTEDCTIEIDPQGPEGLLLRDKRIVILNPDPSQPNLLSFGDTGECRISAALDRGMLFEDPHEFRFVGGPVFAQDFIQKSSRRFKADIRPIEDALQKIAKLQGVYFNWKESSGGDASLGFIAEDVATVLPELVTYEQDGESAQGLDYSKIVAVAVEGVKAQQQQIEKLESRNAELENELAEMRALLEQIAEKLEQD